MFSYYGSKASIVHRYPPPEHSRIVEPFAGSARYSLRWAYPERDVVLIEIDPDVYEVWKWLVYDATVHDIRQLPVVRAGEDLRDITSLSRPERLFLGYSISRGASTPKNIVTKRADRTNCFGKYWRPRSLVETAKEDAIRYLPRIKHWKVVNTSYEEYLINHSSTWFIDPPYMLAGEHYRFGASGIDYVKLAEWCRTRRGQVIVCEGPGADWLPFTDLNTGRTRGCRNVLREKVWISCNM